MTQIHAIGIVGSPRRGGNTDCLVGEVLRGAAAAGASVSTVFLADLEIAPCCGCDACLDSGQCIHDDDMPALLERMRQNHIWVLGTPVYWWGPSAQFKTFLDRWYQAQPVTETVFGGKRVILIIPMGDKDPATARHTVGMLTDALDYVKAELFATVLAPGVSAAGEVREKQDLLAAAYHAGERAVADLTSCRR